MAEAQFASHSDHVLVVAFDFGTTYSGYAFSFHDSPSQIQTNQGWIAGSEKLMSLKTPTCVLLNPDKEFNSFGYTAENRYADMAIDNTHHGWYLFRRFKMMLHKEKSLSRNTTIEDFNGKSMMAMTIFGMSIRFLRDHLLDCLENQATGIIETDIQYVLTVPAIWSDGAKQFMREAAIEAGIDTDRLKIALEPEAASIWCKTITEEAKLALSSTGNQYMIVDLGGGTADISVHELKPDGTLKEIHKASGGPWGGIEVDNNYLNMLTDLVGERVMTLFKEAEMGDYFDIFREFEMKKRIISKTTDGPVTFRLSTALKEIYEESGNKFSEAVMSSELSSSLKVVRDKLRIDADVVRSWFKVPIQSLVNHVKGILSESAMNQVDTIVLVGGFGECELVHDEIKAQVMNKRVIIPKEAGLSVLKGAVKFGHMPTIISTRVLNHTYGRAACCLFDHDKHSKSKLVIRDDGKEWCNHVFNVIARVGDSVDTGHKVTSEDHCPFASSQTSSSLQIYCSDSSNPQYTTDPESQYLGQLEVSLPEGNTIEDKYYDMTYIFGDTEIMVKAKLQKTGKVFQTSIDCL